MSEQESFEKLYELHGDGSSYHLCKLVWNAATAEANKRTHTIDAIKFQEALDAMCAEKDKRIDALEGEVTELKSKNLKLQDALDHIASKFVEQVSSNKYLREALEEIARDSFVDSWQNKLAQKALSATPAESLAKHDDELIEKVIAVIESLNVDAMFKPVSFSDMFVAIRALKGK